MKTKNISKAVVILLLLCVTLLGCARPQSDIAESTKNSEISAISTTLSDEKSTTKNSEITTEKSVKKTEKSTTKLAQKSTTKHQKKGKVSTTIGDEISTTRRQISDNDEALTTKKKSDLCTITIECKEIQKHTDKLAPGHSNFVPKNGYIISNFECKISGEMTVYDILKKACKDNNIILTSRDSQYGAYIVGINNIDEKDCGESSGWLYYVNGKKPNYACDKYYVKPGDKIVFSYICEWE